MPQQHRNDPYRNFNFRVEIDGLQVAGFSEARLPEGRIQAVAYREGTDGTSAARLLPGRVEYGPVVLRRGLPVIRRSSAGGTTSSRATWRDATSRSS